mgnify:CR=1 FL=1
MQEINLKEDWRKVQLEFSKRFSAGEEMDLDGILFLIGVQEVGFGAKAYKKSDKLDIIHVAICRLLEPYGYYLFKGVDEQLWPHYEACDTLPFLKPGEQSLLIKESIVLYCRENRWI